MSYPSPAWFVADRRRIAVFDDVRWHVRWFYSREKAAAYYQRMTYARSRNSGVRTNVPLTRPR